MWVVWGQAGKQRAAGISLAVGVRADGQGKEELGDPGF